MSEPVYILQNQACPWRSCKLSCRRASSKGQGCDPRLRFFFYSILFSLSFSILSFLGVGMSNYWYLFCDKKGTFKPSIHLYRFFAISFYLTIVLPMVLFRSFSLSENNLCLEGVVEIWLTSEDLGTYGMCKCGGQ